MLVMPPELFPSSAVVAGLDFELPYRVLRGRDQQNAAAAAVIRLTAIDLPVVGVLPHSVEVNAPVLPLRAGKIEVRHIGRSAGNQLCELENIAAVGGEIIDLPAGDGLADIARIRLHLDGASFHGDALPHSA